MKEKNNRYTRILVVIACCMAEFGMSVLLIGCSGPGVNWDSLSGQWRVASITQTTTGHSVVEQNMIVEVNDGNKDIHKNIWSRFEDATVNFVHVNQLGDVVDKVEVVGFDGVKLSYSQQDKLVINGVFKITLDGYSIQLDGYSDSKPGGTNIQFIFGRGLKDGDMQLGDKSASNGALIEDVSAADSEEIIGVPSTSTVHLEYVIVLQKVK